MNETVIQCTGCARYRKHGEREGPCRCGAAFVRREKVPQNARRKPGPRVSAEELNGMRAAYESGKSFAEVGRMFPRKHGKPRHPGDVRTYLVAMGVEPRLCATALRPKDEFNRLLPNVRLTDDEVRDLVHRMVLDPGDHGFRLPEWMKNEWRGYSMERRKWVISLMRERFPSTRPSGEFSANVQPFDYTTPEAWQIVNAVNSGLPSRKWKMRLFLCSEGVIFEGSLWYWVTCTGYMRGIWTEDDGRPSLHHHIWERENGMQVPDGHVVRHADGNANNFEPVNLVLASRDELCRESQAKALTKKSRELTSLLLQRQQRNPHGHEKSDLITQIHRSKSLSTDDHTSAKQRPRRGRAAV